MSRGKDILFGTDEYYHLYGRGVGKKKIFLDERDYARFIFLILYFQSPILFDNIRRNVSYFLKNGSYSVLDSKVEDVIKQRYIYLSAFAIMPNHFHLLVKSHVDGGIPKYMKRALGGYGKYFNEKYKESGHVFQGSYNAVHIGDNTQLLHTSAYIHKNPKEIARWHKSEHKYPWSTYQDYTDKNRWGNLIERSVILDQFKTVSGYTYYLQKNTAKELL